MTSTMWLHILCAILIFLFYLSWLSAWGHPSLPHHGSIRPGREDMMCTFKPIMGLLHTFLLYVVEVKENQR